jgi:hypothetical protein
MRVLLPFFNKGFSASAYGRVWQVSVGIAALFAPQFAGEIEIEVGEPKLELEELVTRAITHQDEHVIKLTEACVREIE